eukprot:NODE_197_length_13258_cov_0.852344.p3 type:complete len:598 gc:universal NODE_197_length_13258_cov_0.852344:1966-3759(+)
MNINDLTDFYLIESMTFILFSKSQNMSQELAKSLRLKSSKPENNENKLIENGIDVTPLPFYPVQMFGASTGSLVQLSNPNLSKGYLKNNVKNRKMSTLPTKQAIIGNILDLIPKTEAGSLIFKEEPVQFDESVIKLSKSPLYVIYKSEPVEFPIEQYPKYTKMNQTIMGIADCGTQDDYAAVQLNMESSDDEVEQDGESDNLESLEGTEQSSVVSSLYSLSTSKSKRFVDVAEKYDKIIKKHSKSILSTLNYLKNYIGLCHNKKDVALFYEIESTKFQDIRLLFTVKPLNYKGKCVSIKFSDQNGLILVLFAENMHSSTLVIWEIVDFFDSKQSQPLKLMKFDMSLKYMCIDENTNVLYLGGESGCLFVLSFDKELQSCEIIFDSRLLSSYELCGMTHVMVLENEETPTLMVSNFKGQLLTFKVAKRMASSVTAYFENQSSVFILSFCTFMEKIVVLGSDGSISIIDSKFTGQKCVPKFSFSSTASKIACSSEYLGILLYDSFKICQNDFVFRSLGMNLISGDQVTDFAFNPVSPHCCAITTRKGKTYVYLLNENIDEPKDSYFLPDRKLCSISFSPNGHSLFVGDEDGIFTMFALQ